MTKNQFLTLKPGDKVKVMAMTPFDAVIQILFPKSSVAYVRADDDGHHYYYRAMDMEMPND